MLFRQVRNKPGLSRTAEADDMKRLLSAVELEPRASTGLHFSLQGHLLSHRQNPLALQLYEQLD